MENNIQTKTQTEMQAVAETETQSCDEPEIHTTTCLNCGKVYEGNYCPECGQSAETGRFTFKFIVANLIAAFFGKDGGIWFSFKNLFTRPGAMIVEILNGKRRPYFSPIPMLIFTLTIYILLFSFTGSKGDIDELRKEYSEVVEEEYEELEEMSQKAIRGVNEMERLVAKGMMFYYTHYTTVIMLTIPFFLIATRAWYGKENRKRYYRAEYLVAIVYSMVMVVVFRCVVSVVYLFSHNVSDHMVNFVPIVIAAAFTACFSKMTGFSLGKTAWRSLLAVGLYYVILGLVLLILCGIVGLYVYYFVRKL